MPYIEPKLKNKLNNELRSLARKIIVVAKKGLGESPLKRISPYRHACWELGPRALPTKRYTLLSGIRASFGDACDDWCWRQEVKPQTVEFSSTPYFPELNTRINRLARKIRQIVLESKDDLVFQGILTYCWIFLGILVTDKNDKIMKKCIAGTLRHLYRDKTFYPTVMIPYEQKQIKKNGDVYPK